MPFFYQITINLLDLIRSRIRSELENFVRMFQSEFHSTAPFAVSAPSLATDNRDSRYHHQRQPGKETGRSIMPPTHHDSGWSKIHHRHALKNMLPPFDRRG